LIQEIVGPGVQVIDPAPAVARQVRRVLEREGLLRVGDDPGKVEYETSGDPVKFMKMVRRLGKKFKAQV